MKPAIRVTLIIVAVLALLIIIIWPMAPLWQKLGLEPKCIQGEWPHLKLVNCSGEEAAEITPMPLPAIPVEGAIPIIVDDDGSPDGMVALLYFLSNPLFDVRAVTVSYGEAHPGVFAPSIARLLAAYGYGSIPVGYGKDAPLAGENAFPEPWRQGSNDFWGLELAPAQETVSPVPAAELIVEVVSASPLPVMIFVSGAHTNLAEALRLEPSIAGNIRDVYIMGGAVEVPGNIHSDWAEFENETAEWNIWVDPLAASEVFSSGLDLHLIPLDATSKVLWSSADASAWERGSPEGAFAADFLNMMLEAWSVESAYVWDLVAAAQATLPSLCVEETMSLQVVTSPGADEGRTLAVEGAANISVCLDPAAGQVRALVRSVFQAP